MFYGLENLIDNIFSNPVLAIICIAIVVRLVNNQNRKNRRRDHNDRMDNIRMRNKENWHKNNRWF